MKFWHSWHGHGVYDPAGLSVDRGDIVAAMRAYAPDDTHAGGPSLDITVRWHWDGQRFVRLPYSGASVPGTTTRPQGT